MKKNLLFITVMLCFFLPLYAQQTYENITGTVLSTGNYLPLIGATIKVENAKEGAVTDTIGHFSIHINYKNRNPTLIISSIGYETKKIKLTDGRNLKVYLNPIINKLDEAIIRAYGTTTRRLNTGSISKITAKEIERQPVSNSLAALEGRVPGLVITQSNGLPGSNFKIELRGRNSLSQGTQPLFIVDGVPYSMNSTSLAQITSPANQSPLNSINPADIKSIEVLKDADATAIYGSQGANGVILITTKKGKPGKTRLDINYYTGIGKITRTVNLLNTSQYIQMRREAFANDSIDPTASTAPDFFLWDTARYTDWKKMLIGGTARISNIQATLSGGGESTQFLLSASHYAKKNIFPNSVPTQRNTARLNLAHNHKKFNVNISLAYSQALKKMPFTDLTRYIYLPPNAPDVYDSTNNLNWEGWIKGADNPLSSTEQQYESETDNLIGNAVIQYELFHGFIAKMNVGYNFMELDEQYINPIKAQRPSPNTRGMNKIGTNSLKSWILEPQLIYKTDIGKGNLELLLGLSFQERREQGHIVNGTKYIDDDLLGDLSAAGQVKISNNISQYNYTAVFSRLNYNWDNRYLIDVNIRRDGSSRFGPARRFANFSSAGLGWIFSEEKFVKNNFPFIDYGKIRASYGVTGNDQIGDYQYLDYWNSSYYYQYNGATGILPAKLFNPSFEWERNRKLEIAVELGLFHDNLSLSASYFRNRSDNQLVFHKLPAQTGFVSILQNIDALIQNTGWEIELVSRNINSAKFKWITNFNITIPRNKLLRYPGLDISGDKYQYVVGKPLGVIFGYQYLSINDKTGIYQFEDADDDGNISLNDLNPIGTIKQDFYGGFQNTITYKSWELTVFFQYVKQTGMNYLITLPSAPGTMSNQPFFVLDRWQKPGEKSEIQKYTTSASSNAYKAYSNLRNSSAYLEDASFIRLKNIFVSYTLPDNWIHNLKMERCVIYLETQNLITLTRYHGADPETQSLLSLPPLKILTAGLQFTL